MLKIWIVGASLALMGNVALAQSEPPPPPPAQGAPVMPDAARNMNQQGEPGDSEAGPQSAMPEGGEDGWGRDRQDRRERRAWRRGHADMRDYDDHGPMHGEMHGMMGMPGGGMRGAMGRGKGAEFIFRRGNRQGAIVIRCAEEDSTEDCASAVLPLLQLMMPGAAAAQSPGQ